jgi:hypothetical protein
VIEPIVRIAIWASAGVTVGSHGRPWPVPCLFPKCRSKFGVNAFGSFSERARQSMCDGAESITRTVPDVRDQVSRASRGPGMRSCRVPVADSEELLRAACRGLHAVVYWRAAWAGAEVVSRVDLGDRAGAPLRRRVDGKGRRARCVCRQRGMSARQASPVPKKATTGPVRAVVPFASCVPVSTADDGPSRILVDFRGLTERLLRPLVPASENGSTPKPAWWSGGGGN